MPLFQSNLPDDAVFLSRSDDTQLLGTFIPYSFELDNALWPTVEHYYQGLKFNCKDKQALIRLATSPAKARKMGRKRHKSFRKDWQQVREIVMTRAIYIRCRTYPILAEALIETGERMLVENSNYDYHWGTGRDRRGNNAYGKVLMNIRSKLVQEANGNS